MSIEIREIVVRANITQQNSPKQDVRQAAGDRKEIIEECTKRVLAKLRKRATR
jgi:hypothetical protein